MIILTENTKIGNKENVIQVIINRLNAKDICYALLRTDRIRLSTEAEIDLLLHPDDETSFDLLVKEFGFVCWKSRKILKKKVYANFDGSQLFLLDVHFAMIQNGIEYLPYEGVLKRREFKDNFFCLSREDSFLHYFFHNLLGKDHLQGKHIPIIQNLLESGLNRAEMTERISNPKIREILDEFIIHPESFLNTDEHVTNACNEVRRLLVSSSIKNRLRLGYKKKVVGRWSRKRGVHFAFMGVDGAGKSSLISALDKDLGALKGVKHRVVYMGPWGHSLSALHKWILRKQISLPREDETSVPGKLKRVLKGSIYYASVYIELWARYLKEVRPALKKGQLVLSDRYIYDLRYIYKKRAVNGFKGWRFFICYFFPKPDKIIFLYNEPEIIVSRKPQLSASHIKLFQDMYFKALAGLQHERIVTNRPPKIIASQIMQQMIRLLLTPNQGR